MFRGILKWWFQGLRKPLIFFSSIPEFPPEAYSAASMPEHPPVVNKVTNREAFAPEPSPVGDKVAEREAFTPGFLREANIMADRKVFAPELLPEVNWVACTPVLAPLPGFEDDFVILPPDFRKKRSLLHLLTSGRKRSSFHILDLRMRSICFLTVGKRSFLHL